MIGVALLVALLGGLHARRIVAYYTATLSRRADGSVLRVPRRTAYPTTVRVSRSWPGPVFHHEDYGIAFPLGSKLRKDADDALLEIRENGDFDLIKGKWLGDDA